MWRELRGEEALGGTIKSKSNEKGRKQLVSATPRTYFG
jgi:hypothetical protein